MDVRRAAANTRILAFKALPATQSVKQNDDGQGVPHALWMLSLIELGDEVAGEKAHRWLGYAQGLLVTHGVITLEQAKTCNVLA
jgi:hypothetical protein